MRNVGIWLTGLAIIAVPARSAVPTAPSEQATIEQYVRPYVDTNNFSGVVLAAHNGKPVFSRAYGYSDFASRTPNTPATRFHIASMSMQYTAAATLRLVMLGKLTLDTDVSRYVPDLPNGRRITVRHLLTQTSGIRDINGLDDYDQVLREHQTPQSLVAKVSKLPAQRPPGTYEREEHSAFNLLALIIERESGMSFAEAVKRLVFDPLKMRDFGIDDDRSLGQAARGYAPVGVRGLEPAQSITGPPKRATDRPIRPPAITFASCADCRIRSSSIPP